MGLYDLELRALAIPDNKRRSTRSERIPKAFPNELTMAKRLDPAIVIEACARDLHSVAFDFREPARSIKFAEGRIAEVEWIVMTAWAAVRGYG